MNTIEALTAIRKALEWIRSDSEDLRKTDVAMYALTALATLEAEVAGKRAEFDANVNRLKACEHIADGDEGWEVLRNECPSTTAVARLRDRLASSPSPAEAMREAAEPSPEWLDVVARSIGRTTGNNNHIARAKDVFRSLREGDLTIPSATRTLPPAPSDEGSAVEVTRYKHAALKAQTEIIRWSNHTNNVSIERDSLRAQVAELTRQLSQSDKMVFATNNCAIALMDERDALSAALAKAERDRDEARQRGSEARQAARFVAWIGELDEITIAKILRVGTEKFGMLRNALHKLPEAAIDTKKGHGDEL